MVFAAISAGRTVEVSFIFLMAQVALGGVHNISHCHCGPDLGPGVTGTYIELFVDLVISWVTRIFGFGVTQAAFRVGTRDGN